MKKRCLKWTWWLLALPGSVWADEARIPIFQPTTITQAGSYFLTRDIAIPGGTAIAIQASHVTLDLNGHVLSSPTTVDTDNLIYIAPGSDFIRIRNGKIVGSAHGILYNDSAGELTIWLEKLEVMNSGFNGIALGGALQVEMIDCTLKNTGSNGVEISGNVSGVRWRGRFVGNSIIGAQNRAMLFGPANGIEIRNNLLNGLSGGISFGADGGGYSVEENSFLGPSAAPSDALVISCFVGIGCSNSLVRNNTISGYTRGIVVSANGNLISGNTISGCSSHGIAVSGSNNLIEGNQIQGNTGCGINFFNAGSHAYRNNMVRGNGAGAICGPANTDVGGNIL